METLRPRRHTPALYLLLLALTTVAMFSLKRCYKAGNEAGAGQLESLSEGDTIDVAIEYSPMSFYTYDDTLGGFNYDLLRMIADRHGLTLKFHPVVSLSQSLDMLDRGAYDILAAADIPLTSEFRERYTFLEPVLLDRQVLVQRRDSTTGELPVKSQLDLAGDTVWIIEGSPVATRIQNLSHEIGDTIYTRSESLYGSEQLFLLTATGGIRQAVISERVAQAMLPDYPDMDASTSISFTQFLSWIAGSRHPGLPDSLNAWIADMKSSPEYARLLKRYNH